MRKFGRNTILRSLFEQAAREGVSRQEILSEIDLDASVADQPGAFIASEKLIDAVEYAAIASGRKDFGLQLGGAQNHRLLGPVGLLVEHCRTVAEAVAEGSRYLHLHNSALLYTLTTQADRSVFRLQLLARGKYAPTQYVEALLTMFLRFCRLLLSPSWAPLAVSFEHERIGPLSSYRKFFGTADIQFGQPINAVIARKADFNQPVKKADPRIKRLITDLLDDLEIEHAESFPVKVTLLIRPLLHSGTVTAAKIATLMNLSPRTFQRRLTAQETSFNQLLREARIQLAKDYMHRQGMSVTKLSESLGFAHVSAVSRFLRENFGQTARDLKSAGRAQGLREARVPAAKRASTGAKKKA